MKRIIFTISIFVFSGFMLFSQTTGKVVEGPRAKLVQQSANPVIPADAVTVVYSEATQTGSGFDPNPSGSRETDAVMAGQFTAYMSSNTANSFTITVVDAPDCAGTYTISCSPVAGSGPGGSTPGLTSITAYIGFPQGNFFFGNATEGAYLITVTNTNNACAPPTNPIRFKAWPNIYTPIFVPVTAVATDITIPTIAFGQPGYTANGHFYIQVTDVDCAGTYTIWCDPVANTAPDLSTPPPTVIIGYIGFPAGNFLFQNAGVGTYKVTVTQTDYNTICNFTNNPIVLYVDVFDHRIIPLSDYAIVLGIALIALVAILRFRRIL